MQWQRSRASRFSRADEKRGEEQPGKNIFYNIEVGEKTGGRWRVAAAMPMKGRSDAAHYGGEKRASRGDLMEN